MSYISRLRGFSDGAGPGGYPYPASSHDYLSASQYETDLTPLSVGGADYVYQISYGETVSTTFWLSDGADGLGRRRRPLIPTLLSAAQAYTTSRKAYDPPAAASRSIRCAHRDMCPRCRSWPALEPRWATSGCSETMFWTTRRYLPSRKTRQMSSPSQCRGFRQDGAAAAVRPVRDRRRQQPGRPSCTSVARPQQTDLGRTVQKPGVAASWLAT